MKTKYILFGGASRKDYLKTKKFFEECLNLPKDEINFLLVYFAKDEARWDECKQRDIDLIRPLTNKKISFVLATPENFEQETKSADIVYLQGGRDNVQIKRLLEKFDLKKLFEGKAIAANSAGVNVLAKYYYNSGSPSIEEGLGILPIKTICHYDPTLEDKLEELKKYKENLKTFALPECEYVIEEQL